MSSSTAKKQVSDDWYKSTDFCATAIMQHPLPFKNLVKLILYYIIQLLSSFFQQSDSVWSEYKVRYVISSVSSKKITTKNEMGNHWHKFI